MQLFLSYLQTALFNFRKQPVFSAIRVLSLTVGLACSILVIMHVQYVQSSNKHIENWENTYRLVTHLKSVELNTPYRTGRTGEPYAPQLKLDYGDQIEYIAKVHSFERGIFSRDGIQTALNSYSFVESDIARIFDLDFIEGNADTALTEPQAVVLTETVARKFFGDEDPMGQTMIMEGYIDLRISGVIRDYPANATHPMEILVSAGAMRQLFGPDVLNDSRWLQFPGTQTFITFPDKATAEQLNGDLANFVQRHMPWIGRINRVSCAVES